MSVPDSVGRFDTRVAIQSLMRGRRSTRSWSTGAHCLTFSKNSGMRIIYMYTDVIVYYVVGWQLATVQYSVRVQLKAPSTLV